MKERVRERRRRKNKVDTDSVKSGKFGGKAECGGCRPSNFDVGWGGGRERWEIKEGGKKKWLKREERREKREERRESRGEGTSREKSKRGWLLAFFPFLCFLVGKPTERAATLTPIG